MAEDAVDQALGAAGLKSRPSVTEELTINGPAAAAVSECLHAELPYTRGDVVRAVRYEMAQTVEDVLARRTRALFLNARAAVEIAPDVATLMAPELGTDEIWVADQIVKFKDLLEQFLPTGSPK